jgi:IMP dehydrogenase
MTPDQTLAEALELMKANRISGIPIVEKSGKLAASSPTATSASPRIRAAGQRADDPGQSRHRAARHQPGGSAAHPPPAADREIAGGRRPTLRRPDHRQGHREIGRQRRCDQGCEGRLRVAAATTVGDKPASSAREALIDAGCDCIVIDTAHGHNVDVAKRGRAGEGLSNSVQVVAGNVATADAAQGAGRRRRRRDQGRHRPGLDLHDADRRRGRRAAADRDHGAAKARRKRASRSSPTAASAPAATSPRRSPRAPRR